MKKTFYRSMMLVFLASSAYAGGGGGAGGNATCTGCATETTQLLNKAQLVSSVAQQTQMVQQQLQQLQQQMQQTNYAAANTQKVSTSVWGNAQSLLTQLQSIVQQGNALSYANANADSQFRQIYPGYSPTTNYSQSYQGWSGSTMDSIRGTLDAANLQSQNFSTENGLIQQLQTLSQSSGGQVQAVQTGNMIAMQMVQQMQKLRQLQMAQMQEQSSYLATQQQKSITDQANQDNLFGTIPDPRTTTQYQYFQGGSN